MPKSSKPRPKPPATSRGFRYLDELLVDYLAVLGYELEVEPHRWSVTHKGMLLGAGGCTPGWDYTKSHFDKAVTRALAHYRWHEEKNQDRDIKGL